jgi:hypothetical protein
MAPGEFVILSAFGLATAVALPIVLHFRAERRKRELDHIERMRAIEVGRSYPGERLNGLLSFPQWAVPHLISLSIGAAVPLGVFLCAFLSTLIGGFHKEIWIGAGMVGLGGVISGACLAGTICHPPSSTGGPEYSGSYGNSKPLVDEDAYDVVSARG